jgi:hypothetical protein
MGEAQSKIDRMKAHLILDYLIDAYQGTEDNSLSKRFMPHPSDRAYVLSDLLRILEPATGRLLLTPQIMKRERRQQLDGFKENRRILLYIIMRKEGYPQRGAKAAALRKVSEELQMDQKTIERWGAPPELPKAAVDFVFDNPLNAKSRNALEKWTFDYLVDGLKLNSREIDSRLGTSNR